MKRFLIVALVCSCAHQPAVDPSAAAPPPWPAATTPPPAREPVTSPVAAPKPTPAPELPRVAKDRDLPGEGPLRPFALPRPERVRLSSGADLLFVRRTRLPVATILVVWPHGVSQESVARAGLASLTADLLTNGAGKRPAIELAAELERQGLRLTAQSSWDATTVSLTMLTRALDPALALLADVVQRPRFDPSEVDRLRSERKTSLLQLADSANTLAALTGSRYLYGANHRYGELLQGSTAGLTAITRDDIVAWHAQQLRIDQATIIAVGDLDLKTLKQKLDKILGKAPATPPLALVKKDEPAAHLGAKILLVDRPGAAQTELRMYEPGPPRNTPDYFPLLVLNTIFGGNFSSRLNAKLREEKGYTYGARSEFAFRREGGPFSAGAPVKTAVTRPALVDLRAEITRIGSGLVNDTELRVAKQTLQRSLARTFETDPDVAASLAALKVYGLPEDYFSTYADKIEAVNQDDLIRVAHGITPAMMTLVVVGDEKVIGPEVKAELGAYEKVDPRAK